MRAYESPYAIIIPALLEITGAIVIFIICFKKQPGTLGKKGLFATAMLGVYILFSQVLFNNMNAKQLLIPMLGFAALSIVEIFYRDNK